MKQALSLLLLLFCIFPLATQAIITITDDDLQADQIYHWTSDHEYLLEGLVVLESGGELIIDPGTVIRGKMAAGDVGQSVLVIETGARIHAVGTETQPIVFTAEADNLNDPTDVPLDAENLWGGIMIVGQSYLSGQNGDGTVNFILLDFDYEFTAGGNDDEDSSGELRYVSIRYAGSNDNEFLIGSSSLNLIAVGSGTTINHLEIYQSNFNGLEIYGGTVNLNRVISAYSRQNAFNIKNSYRGVGQFWVGLDNESFPNYEDASIEVQKTLFSNECSVPNLANISLLGYTASDIFIPGGDAVRISNDCGGQIRNSFFSGYTKHSVGLYNDPASDEDARNRLLNDELIFNNNHFNNLDSSNWDWAEYVGLFTSNSEGLPNDPLVNAKFSGTNQISSEAQINGNCFGGSNCLDPRPLPGSAIANGGIPILESGFTPVNFQGAFSPDYNWAQGWSLTFGTDTIQSIRGYVRANTLGDCSSPADILYNGAIVTFTNDTVSYQVSTDNNGFYLASLPAGVYEVSAITPNGFWVSCQSVSTVTLPAGDTLFYNFELTANELCSDTHIEIASPLLRRCFESNYYVSYGNWGTVETGEVSIQVVLDEFLDYQSSSVPLLSQNGDTLTFMVDNIDPLETETFQITVLVSCEADLGYVHCTEASITTEECTLPESAQLEVVGFCDGDSVRFSIENVSDFPTLSDWNYIVIEDEIMLHGQPGSDPPGAIGPNETLDFAYPNEGSTFFTATHAYPDEAISHYVSITISCTNNPDAGPEAFPLNDAINSVSIDCQPNIGAYDPNDKIGYPLGLGLDNKVREEQRIDYRIRFQNTGTDTAFNVKVVDTLSEHLDLTTFRMGVSSHNFTWRIGEDRELTVLFNNIMLPDSFVNEPLSNGFFTFSVVVAEDLPIGTQIFNEAAIYFDFNEPIITNRTLHTISDFFNPSTGVNGAGPSLSHASVVVFPQPAEDLLNFRLLNVGVISGGVCNIYNLSGQRIAATSFSNNGFSVNTSLFKTGIYFYQLTDRTGKLLAAGKWLKK